MFYYIPKEKEEQVLETGLRLSEFSNRVVNIDGVKKSYIAMLINPKDDKYKYNNKNFIPLKIEIEPDEIFVADGALYHVVDELSQNSMYLNSFTLLTKYIFGTFRKPECLIPYSISHESISKMDKRIDVPVLYESSEDFYVEREIERCKETYDNFMDKLLYHYYKHLVSKGYCIEHYSKDDSIYVFESKIDGRIVTIRRR